jgi:hypothetical protein
MLEHKIAAGTQNNDLTGLIAIDREQSANLVAIAEKNGIDTSRYLPISIGVNKEECFEKVFLDTVEVASTYEELKDYLAKNPGALPVKRFELSMLLTDYLNIVKRFSLVAAINKDLLGIDIRLIE